jgi:hypothetical protein
MVDDGCIEDETMVETAMIDDGKECKAVIYVGDPGKIYERDRVRVAGPYDTGRERYESVRRGTDYRSVVITPLRAFADRMCACQYRM